MDSNVITEIFELCIIPLLAILTRYVVKFVETKIQEAQTKAKNETEKKYLEMIENTIVKCVKTTNQTYVDTLKQQGKFDDAAQQEAFKRTFDAVLVMLSKDAMDYIGEITSDTNKYLTQLIESTVGDVKK